MLPRNFMGRNRAVAATLAMSGFTTAVLMQEAARVHKANIEAGWWSDPATGERIERNKGVLLKLAITETSEAAEGARKSAKVVKMDDKLTHRPMEEVEMADVIIRMFDYCGAYGYQLEQVPCVRWHSDEKLECLMQIDGLLYKVWYHECTAPDRRIAEYYASQVFAAVAGYCSKFNHDLIGAYEEKLAFNKVRPDHKAEARLAAGGKSQ